MLYSLYIIGFYLIKIMPLRASYFVSDLAANIYYLFAKKDRENLAENLKIVLGPDADDKKIEKCIRGIFINFARYLVDFFKFTEFTQDFISRKAEFVGIENLDKCLSEGKGAIALTPHLGNWELGAALIAAKGYPLTAIVLEHKDKRIDDFFTRQRRINNLKLVPLGMQVKQCFGFLKNNEILAIAGDKDYTSTGDQAEFFGKTAFIPKGPAVFSLRTGAPIIVTTCVRKKDDSFVIRFEEPIRYKPTGDEEKDIRALMGEYLAKFENRIREHPDQWYAFQKIWNQGLIIR
ncbi:MAG: lysophospholipid acyltransferase family protein [Candidatus Omnitrophota bacterium]